MSLRNLFLANTLVELSFGLVALLAPAQVLSLAGATLSEPAGILYARMFGTAIISMGLLSGLTLATSPIVPLESAVTTTLLVFHSLLAAVLIIGQLTGVRDSWGWTVVGLHLFFAGSFAYFRFSSKIAKAEVGI
jgi:uncharacterized protein YjeT (DUF2065 family)